MPITDTPNVNELPSSSRLLKSTLVAMVVAMVLLVVAVLPAEYGVDITGAGRVLGLTEMGQLKVELAKEAAAAEAADAAARPSGGAATGGAPVGGASATNPVAEAAAAAAAVNPDSQWTHTVVPLAPNQGREVKLVMPKGARAEYEWSVAGGKVNYDMHGDSTGAPNSYFSYKKGTGAEGDAGSLVAEFDGAHGWFWRNRGTELVNVTLRTRGAYTELKKMY